MRDSINTTSDHLLFFPPQVASGAASGTSGVVTGDSIDLLGFDAAHFTIHLINLTGVSSGVDVPAVTAEQTGSAIQVQESDDDVTFTLAPDSAVIKSLDAAGAIEQPEYNKGYRIGYRGSKRYANVVVTPTNATKFVITGHKCSPGAAPTANPA